MDCIAVGKPGYVDGAERRSVTPTRLGDGSLQPNSSPANAANALTSPTGGIPSGWEHTPVVPE